MIAWARRTVNDSELTKLTKRDRQPATALTVIMAFHHRSIGPQAKQACSGRGHPVNDSDVTDRDRQPVTALTVMMALLVHHLAKRSRRNLGQSLRGSGDLHAWTDSACYLLRRADDRLLLTVEHRCAPSPDPLLLRLAGGGEQPVSLLVDSAAAAPPPLAEAVRATLRSAGQPLSRTALRQRLRVNNARLGGSRWRPANSRTARPRRPRPRRLAPASVTTLGLPTRCRLAAVPPFPRSAPGTRSERNGYPSTLGASHRAHRAYRAAYLVNPLTRIELNRFAVGVASAVSGLGALPKHNSYVLS